MKIEFSVAERINVKIWGELSKDCFGFLKMIYKNFDALIDVPCFILKIKVTDEIPQIDKQYSLGKDGYYNENTLILKSGHFFIREEEAILTVGIPTKVKRGRIPFKRITPGRHITDEIAEPLLYLLLQRCGATFVHASSIFLNDKVDVLMGWRGTGKTNAILTDIGNKEVWSDDLAIIDAKGYVYPYLRPIRLYSYNLPLLDPSYLKTHQLNLKKYITPPWRPVHYLPLIPNSDKRKALLNQLSYLNNPTSENLAEDAKTIMDFEQIFFRNYQLMLDHSGILRTVDKTEEIISKALNA